MTDRISAADQLVLLLRQRLTEHSQTQRKGSGAAGKAASGRQAAPLHAIQALAATEGLDDRVLKRAIIQNILAEKFGSGLVNEAEFQQVVDKVVATLGDHAGGSDLLSRLVREMRATATGS
jgi:hypothetical protein